MTINCGRCGTPIEDDDAEYCPFCGGRIKPFKKDEEPKNLLIAKKRAPAGKPKVSALERIKEKIKEKSDEEEEAEARRRKRSAL
jgi:predicted  nucleic acid-binding Zn-ribbon protein